VKRVEHFEIEVAAFETPEVLMALSVDSSYTFGTGIATLSILLVFRRRGAEGFSNDH
jgi:hypothetical protein